MIARKIVNIVETNNGATTDWQRAKNRIGTKSESPTGNNVGSCAVSLVVLIRQQHKSHRYQSVATWLVILAPCWQPISNSDRQRLRETAFHVSSPGNTLICESFGPSDARHICTSVHKPRRLSYLHEQKSGKKRDERRTHVVRGYKASKRSQESSGEAWGGGRWAVGSRG